ncbi:MAG: PAS domain-containing protein, partial [Methanomicrobiales archaeon]|nr:PAS domain-containing protein [Methanomicrobiales archaeon]
MERPGRKALFTGSPQGGAQPVTEPAKGIDYGFAGNLSSAIDAVISGKTGVRLDPAAFDAPLRDLVTSINSMFERVAAEQEVQRQCTTLFGENPLPMVLLDRSFNLVDLNEAYEDMMEQERDRLIRMEATDYKIRLLKGDKTEKTFKGIRTKAELEIVFADGRRKIVEQYGIPVADATGSTISAYFVYNDVTKERSEAEEIQKQIKKNEALQRRAETIVQENPMPILLVTRDFKIVVTNEAFVTMSGIKRDDILKMSARDFKISNQKGEGLGAVIKEKRKSFGEVTVDLPSGTHILEQYGIPILNAEGDLANILIVYNDVTREREEMEEVNILKKRAEAFIKENPQGITILANDKHRLDLNKEYERIWRGS